MWREVEPLIMIKPDQIVIAAALMYPLLIKQLDNNVKLSIKGSNLVAGIDVMAQQGMIIPPGEQSPVNTGITLMASPGTFCKDCTMKWPSSQPCDRHRGRSYR
jgi:hypothetical protein